MATSASTANAVLLESALVKLVDSDSSQAASPPPDGAR